ncbi:hypothetical protein CMUS01_10318 [Colletotrichum musicola]|uniref:Uncharacterized protein n=1 Tax=Colletotrichum musicola TaxID=2175873 RepID=A0A8H6N954_9PEZI|nr:hypothetical protein CMUS01_10318 [Colletotrichum musicola]
MQSSGCSAYNNDRTKVIGHSCSTSLTLGASSIAFTVDRNGYGNITVNERDFLITDDLELSGGRVCGRVYSDLETVVNCEVAVTIPTDLPSLHRGSFPGCISKRSPASGDALDLEATLEGFISRPTFLPQEQPLAPENTSALAERQICGV